MVQMISPREAERFHASAVDVREWPEYAAGAIEGSRLIPLGILAREARGWDKKQPVLLICRSGRRAERAAITLDQLGFENVSILSGGIEAWRAQGLPLRTSTTRLWSLERQVRGIAGVLVLAFTLLSLTVSTWFAAGALFVGTGLLFAGITDLCLMAALLSRLPWNRPAGLRCGVRAAAQFGTNGPET